MESPSSTSTRATPSAASPANADDSAFCLLLGQNAVHAGMAGRTNMVVGFWMNTFTHVPIPLAVSRRKKVDPDGLGLEQRVDQHGAAQGHPLNGERAVIRRCARILLRHCYADVGRRSGTPARWSSSANDMSKCRSNKMEAATP